MDEPRNHLKRSVGAPFWAGCLVGPILFMLFLAALGILRDQISIQFFGCIAVVIFGPIGGLVFQAFHDLLAAHRLRMIRAWDVGALVAVIAGLFIAGCALFSSAKKTEDIDPFRSEGFDIAAGFVVLVVVVYALGGKVISSSSQRSDASSPRDTLPEHIRAFVAGAFALMSLQDLVQGTWQFVASMAAGRPEWLVLALTCALGGGSVALALALFSGRPRALHWIQTLLALSVAGSCCWWICSRLGLVPAQGRSAATAAIVSLLLLALIVWYKQPVLDDTHDTEQTG